MESGDGELLSASPSSPDTASAPVPPPNPSLKTSSQLPAELWCHILGHVDNYTLWTVCHRVSRAMQSEAEREFRLTRLHELRFRWNFEFRCFLLQIRTGQIETQGGVDHVSGVGQRFIHYKYGMDCEVLTNIEDHQKPKLVRKAIKAALKRRDPWEEKAGRDRDGMHRRRIGIGTSLQDIALPSFDINFDTQTLSFDWRPFITVFHSFETAFRTEQQKHPHLISEPTPDESEWFEKRFDVLPISSNRRVPPWEFKYTQSNSYLWYCVCHRYYIKQNGSLGLGSHPRLKTHDEFKEAHCASFVTWGEDQVDWIFEFAKTVQKDRRDRLQNLLQKRRLPKIG